MAGNAILDEPAVEKSIKLQTSASKKVVIDKQVRFMAEAAWPDGGKFDVLLTEAPCVIPQRSADGGEDEVDCQCQDGPDAGHRWRGCNVCPREWSRGAQCIPSACSVTAGDTGDDALY